MTDLTTTLADRKKSHGNFADNAVVIQNLKRDMKDTENWGSLSSAQREALEMIQHKIGRILSGDANHIDSWHDICGYAKLVEDILTNNACAENSIAKVRVATEGVSVAQATSHCGTCINSGGNPSDCVGCKYID